MLSLTTALIRDISELLRTNPLFFSPSFLVSVPHHADGVF